MVGKVFLPCKLKKVIEMKKLIAWVEIPSSDFERAVNFYSKILNITLEPLDFGPEKMACLPNDEGAIFFAQGYKPSPEGVLVSFHVGNIDKTLEQINELGGKVTKEKTKIEAEGRGYFAHFIDSEGNRIGLYSDN